MSKKRIVERISIEYKDTKKGIILLLLIILISFNIFNTFFIVKQIYESKKITGYGTSSGVISIIIEEWRSINITHPLNKTYNFSQLGSYPVQLNVSSNFNSEIHAWFFTLEDITNNLTLNNSEVFTPNITIYPARYSNRLSVFANRTGNYSYNDSVVFFVSVINFAPSIQDLNTNILACEGTFLSEKFNVSDVDEQPITPSLTPQYPQNPFYIQFLYNVTPNLTTHEIYSGTLNKSDAGGILAGSKTYNATVSVTDSFTEICCSESKKINLTVIEINNAPVIENIGVQTIWASGDNSTFYKQVNVSDIESGDSDDGNMTFNVTILNSSGSNVSLFNVSSLGIINHTANLSETGVYNVTICVIDQNLSNAHQNISLCGQSGSNRTDCEKFGLTVTNQNRAPDILTHYPNNSNFTDYEGATGYFNITARDPDGTITDTYWYVDDVFKEYDNDNLSSEFNYIWSYTDSGVHEIFVEITDGALNDSFSWNVTILDVVISTPSGGGGGGGGGGGVSCKENWGCSVWSECKYLSNNSELKSETIMNLENLCKEQKIDRFQCGYQVRICNELNNCLTSYDKPEIIRNCVYTGLASCSDKVKNCHDNSCEVLVDCGGPCEACASCSDGIKNQEEDDIDCGGHCKPCRENPIITVISKKESYFFLLLLLLIIVVILFIRYELHRYNVGRLMREREKRKIS